ncbi:2517_t:CDS:2, partial [Rhizophagus irregularis]
ISYTSHYSACNTSDIFKTGHHHMYSWQLANFQLARSSNPVPLKDKRRVLSVPVTECSIIGIPKNLQKDWSPLYKKARIAPLIEDYPFNIPHGFMAPLPQPEVGIDNLLESVVDMAMIIEPTKDDLVVHTVSPYCPVPDIFIPHKYRNIIPPNPLFDDNDSFITPGSQEWFTFMYNLEKNMSQEDRAIAIEAIVYEKHVDLRRLDQSRKRDAHLYYHKTRPQSSGILYSHKSSMIYADIHSPYTFDDSKLIESRPNKRDVDHNRDPYDLIYRKPSRQDSLSVFDSTVAGSVK